MAAAQVATPSAPRIATSYLPLIQQSAAPRLVEASAIDDPPSLSTKYYYFNGQRIAMRQTDGALLYLHSDHLGSTSLVTKADGATQTDQGYRAYGRYRRGGALPTDHRFTGQKLDATGLYYYNARYYDPEIGQFISPDPFVPDPSNLFAYNRYMYVAGNPLRLTDSSGHVWETVLDAVSVGYDVYDIYNNGLSWESGLSLAADVGGLVVPFVPSAGTCIRWCDDAVQYGDEALEYGSKAVNYVGDKLDEGVDAAKDLLGMGDEAASTAKAGADCLVNSFSADTLVMTPSGLKPIAELVEGELVLAYNEVTGAIGTYPIVDTISHVDPEIVLLTIDGETLETTAEHPFYELESAPWLAIGQTKGRWTDALQLKAGDQVWKADGTNGIVQSVTVVPVQQRMYNLTVAEAHTFFVGNGQWLVHNNGPCVQLTIPEKQFGKKVADHAPDYGLDPRNPADREWLRNHIQDIGQNFEEARQGSWHPAVKGGGTDFWFLRKGSDVVVTKGDGTFVTILKNGDTNSWFRKAIAVTQN